MSIEKTIEAIHDFYYDLRKLECEYRDYKNFKTEVCNLISIWDEANNDEIIDELKRMINKPPKIINMRDVVPRFGHWEVAPGRKAPTKFFVCSNCKNELETPQFYQQCNYRFCPVCGSINRPDLYSDLNDSEKLFKTQRSLTDEESEVVDSILVEEVKRQEEERSLQCTFQGQCNLCICKNCICDCMQCQKNGTIPRSEKCLFEDEKEFRR